MYIRQELGVKNQEEGVKNKKKVVNNPSHGHNSIEFVRILEFG